MRGVSQKRDHSIRDTDLQSVLSVMTHEHIIYQITGALYVNS